MARISKPIRILCYPIVSIGLSLLICKGLQYFIGIWVYLFYLPLFLLFHILSPIDFLDLWLRKVTKDPVWLMTEEGREWLETEEGKQWLIKKKAK